MPAFYSYDFAQTLQFDLCVYFVYFLESVFFSSLKLSSSSFFVIQLSKPDTRDGFKAEGSQDRYRGWFLVRTKC